MSTLEKRLLALERAIPEGPGVAIFSWPGGAILEDDPDRVYESPEAARAALLKPASVHFVSQTEDRAREFRLVMLKVLKKETVNEQ